MAEANPLWGAPRIHGELLKLGIDVCQATVAKYMGRRCQPPSQTWQTFLRNQVGQIVAADFFVVPTVTYRLVFVVVLHAHDQVLLGHLLVEGRELGRFRQGRRLLIAQSTIGKQRGCYELDPAGRDSYWRWCR